MSEPKFWDDAQSCAKTIQELKNLKAAVEPFDELVAKFRDTEELIRLLKEEDKELETQIAREIDSLLNDLEKLEFKTLLADKLDINNAILSINAGAGGTESCDWVGMLARMYSRWAEDKGYKVKVIDMLPGEEAGIKNITYLVQGQYAYGYLKAERGVHRLVRISPFDANKRRHTSFASVDVLPQIKEEKDFTIKPEELRIETFRASGRGGQHVNRTDSAVRITHLPTGLVVSCQNERSQHQNKQLALSILKAKLYNLREEERKRDLEKLAGQKQRIEWGSQIRSYVLYPYLLVKDHRTDFETADARSVLDGKLDDFIFAYLKKKAQGAEC